MLEHQHGPQLCVEGLAASLREPPRPAALNSHKSKTKLNRGWGTACPLFSPQSPARGLIADPGSRRAGLGLGRTAAMQSTEAVCSMVG